MTAAIQGLQPRELGLIAAALALVADQSSKLYMLYGAGFADMPAGASVPVLPFFNLMMVWNPGISYGLFPANGKFGTVLLVVVSVLVVAFLIWWLWRSTSQWLTAGFGFIIGGALGNVIDRLVYGKVADFFHFYGFGYDWYIFNVADVAITIGAILIIYDVIKPEHPPMSSEV
jgi:signal peptidase II